MKIESMQTLNSSTEEVLEIKIVFNPSNPEEEGMAAMVATIVDLVKNYGILQYALTEVDSK